MGSVVDAADGGAAGEDHQRLQQFITSRLGLCGGAADVARWLRPAGVEALVIDDPGFQGRHGVAVRGPEYSGTLGKVANCQVAVSVHLVNEHASCAADWRLFCPESWDDQARPTGQGRAVAAASGGIDQVRHTEKWRLALEMLEEMTAGGWGGWRRSPRRRAAVVAADADGDTRLRLDWRRGWRTQSRSGPTSAYRRCRPEMMAYSGRGGQRRPLRAGR